MLPKNREPTHPGEILSEEFLKPLGISQHEFSDVFGTTAQFWMNSQTNYDLWHALRKRKKLSRLPAFKKGTKKHVGSRKRKGGKQVEAGF